MFRETENLVVVYYLAGTVLVLLLVAAIVLYAFLHQKKVIQLRIQLHEEDLRRQQAVFDALQEGQERERTRLAEELHDGVGAKLSGLKMNLEYLKSISVADQELVSKIFYGVADTLEEVRAISHNLQPYSFDNKDMEELLLNYMEQLSLLNGCSYDLFMNSPVTDIDKNLKLHSYRIIVELLHNIHKHAHATLASVQISVEEDKLDIIVEDNGIGLNKSRSDNNEGIGLKNIQNRVNVCKGQMSIDSSEKGTTVIIELPLTPAV